MNANQWIPTHADIYQSLFDKYPSPMWIYDTKTLAFVAVNQAAVIKYGYSREEFMVMTLKDIRPLEDYELLISDIANTTSLVNDAGTWRHKLKNGDVIWVEIVSHLVVFNGRECRHVMAYDVTPRILMEAELRHREMKNREMSLLLESLFDAIPDALIIRDMNNEIIKMNHAARLLQERLIFFGKDLSDLTKGCRRFKGTGVKQAVEWFIPEVKRHYKVKCYDIPSDNENEKLRIELLIDNSVEKRSETVKQIQYNIAEALTSKISIGELFEVVRLELTKIMEADNFYVARFSEKEDMFYEIHAVDELDNITSWPSGQSLSGRVVKHGKPLILNRDDLESYAKETGIEQVGTLARSWLGAPLYMGESIKGVIVVQSYTDPEAYSDEDIELLQVIANQISLFWEQKSSLLISQQLRQGLESSSVCTVITDSKRHIEYCNPAFTTVTGWSQDEVLNRPIDLLRSGFHDDKFYNAILYQLYKGVSWKGEMLNQKKDGNLFWANTVISPLLSDSGRVTNYIVVIEDISDSKHYLEMLEEAKESAIRNERLKSTFLRNISHEIRTPLNSILGFAEIISTGQFGHEEVVGFSKSISKSGFRLMELLDNVLVLSTIESQTHSMNITNFDGLKVMKEIISVLEFSAEDNNVCLKLVTDLKVANIYTDRFKLHLILKNILSNAIKFSKKSNNTLSDKSTVEVSITHSEDAYLFSISDSGIGIDPTKQPDIYNQFTQIDSSTTRGYDGMGIGLTIVKMLADMIQAKVWFKSEPWLGTTFYLKVPSI